MVSKSILSKDTVLLVNSFNFFDLVFDYLLLLSVVFETGRYRSEDDMAKDIKRLWDEEWGWGCVKTTF